MKTWIKLLVVTVVCFGIVTPLWAQEVIVTSGPDETIALLKELDWWGKVEQGEQLMVPKVIFTGLSPQWQKNAANMPVSQKKGIFYRAMLPLAVHANAMVLDRRERLKRMDATLKGGGTLSTEDDAWLRGLAVVLRIEKKDKVGQITGAAELRKVIAKALYKLDIIPNGLVLWQAAYESGYGTSRFAAKGNALFGQWTYGGKGLVPEQQRKELGDHRIAAYDWPFDSVRGYFINLSSHPAYEDFRRIRAELRAAGKPLSSMKLTEGLKSYSERGQEYVNTLKGIIRVNNLALADSAVFRDEPMRFVVGAPDKETAAKMREEIEAMRKSGELDEIVDRMRLE